MRLNSPAQKGARELKLARVQTSASTPFSSAIMELGSIPVWPTGFSASCSACTRRSLTARAWVWRMCAGLLTAMEGGFGRRAPKARARLLSSLYPEHKQMDVDFLMTRTRFSVVVVVVFYPILRQRNDALDSEPNILNRISNANFAF